MRALVGLLVAGILAGGAVPVAAQSAPAVYAVRLVNGNDQNTSAGMSLVRPLSYKLTGPSGRPIAGATLRLSVQGGARITSDPSALVSDAFGMVHVMVEGAPAPEISTITATAGSAPASYTTVSTVPYLRLNVRQASGRTFTPDWVTADGVGTVAANTSGGQYAPSRWRSYDLRRGAYESTEVPFPDATNGTLSGFAARGPDGSLHLVYFVTDRGTTKMRYSRSVNGAWSAPLDLGSEWVTDGELVADENGADLVYSTFDRRVRHFRIAGPGQTNVDRAVSASSEMAVWPTIARRGTDLFIAYTTFDAAGSHIVIESGGRTSRLERTDLAAAQLTASGERVLMVFTDAYKDVYFSEIERGGGFGEAIDTGLDAPSFADPGRAVVASDQVHALVVANKVVSAATLDRRGREFGPTRWVADLTGMSALQALYLASAPDASGRLVAAMSFKNGNDGGVNAYVLGLDLTVDCREQHDRGEWDRGVGNAQGVRGNGQCHAAETRQRNIERRATR